MHTDSASTGSQEICFSLSGFRFLSKVYLYDEGTKSRIRMLDPRPNKTVAFKMGDYRAVRQIRLPKADDENALVEAAKCLLDEASPYLIQLVCAGLWREITLEQYFYLHLPKIHSLNKWAGSADEKMAIWETDICPKLGHEPLLMLDMEYAKKLLVELSRAERRHRRIGEKEKANRELLYDIYRTAEAEKIIPNNPFAAFKTTNRSPTELEYSNTGIASLTNMQTRKMLQAADSIQDESLRAAIKINLLTPLSDQEICGFNVNDFSILLKVKNDLVDCTVSTLAVTKKYVFDNSLRNWVIQIPLPNQNEYRKYPCSRQLYQIVTDHVRQRRKYGAKKCDPLFVIGEERLTPKMLAETRKDLLRMIGLKPGADAPNGLHIYRENLFAKSALYHFRHDTALDDVEIAYLDGIDRGKVYAQYYVGWPHPLVQMRLAAETERWHNMLFSNEDGSSFDGVSISVFRVRSDDFGQLLLCSSNGCCVQVKRQEK